MLQVAQLTALGSLYTRSQGQLYHQFHCDILPDKHELILDIAEWVNLNFT